MLIQFKTGNSTGCPYAYITDNLRSNEDATYAADFEKELIPNTNEFYIKLGDKYLTSYI